MKDNRRSFIKKGASLAAALSVGSMHAVNANLRAPIDAIRAVERDAGIKFALMMGPTSPRVPYAKQMDVLHAVSDVQRIEGLDRWDPKAISATKDAWDQLGMKWTVVEGPPSLGSQTKLGL